MEFVVGDKVIYPNHGLGYVEEIGSQKISGQNIHFYHLRLVESNSTVLVPVNNVANVGLRKTASRKEIDSLIALLCADCENLTADWKDRYRENTDKMKTGRICDVVEVLRSLALVNTQKNLSFREKKMFDRAKRLLISEIAAVLNLDEDAVEQMVDESLGKAIGPYLPEKE